MSGDETIVFFGCLITAGIFWSQWYWNVFFGVYACYHKPTRKILAYSPVISACLLLLVLKLFAAADVRDSVTYLSAYFIMGAAWTILGVHTFSVLGISIRDHVVERKNPAASWFLSGGMIGVTFCFAGSNIGDGPGWWVVVFCAGLATLALYVVWLIVARLGGAADSITLDRDPASGMRCGAFLIASGLIFGRAAAGDWTSAEAAMADFLKSSWPGVLLGIIAVSMEHKLKPSFKSPQYPIRSHGIFPGSAYILFAIIVVLCEGPWK